MVASKVLLLIVILPIICWAKTTKSKDTPCPTTECMCSEGDSIRGQSQSQMAVCKQFPSQKLPTAVTFLTINGDIGRITKSMMRRLGNNLKMLDLSNCNINSIDSGSFDMLNKLETLKLSGNAIQQIDKETFAKNIRLRALYLNGNKLTNINSGAFSKLEKISELYLENNQLTTIPNKIPDSLMKLIISNNKLGPNLDASDLNQVHNLKELDLSNNHLETVSMRFIQDIGNVQKLRLGDKVLLPKSCARILKHITSLELTGDEENPAQLSETNLSEIGEMKTLTSLSIENYQIPSLSFLHKLSSLMTLKLQHVIITGSVNLRSTMNSNKYLTTVNFDKSPTLSENLLSNIQLISSLHSLRSVSLRNSEVKNVNSFQVPNANFRLDISENPLKCDCSFAWLKDKSVGDVLHSVEQTVCDAPEQFHGKQLMEALQTVQCFDKKERDILHMDGAQPREGEESETGEHEETISQTSVNDFDENSQQGTTHRTELETELPFVATSDYVDNVPLTGVPTEKYTGVTEGVPTGDHTTDLPEVGTTLGLGTTSRMTEEMTVTENDDVVSPTNNPNSPSSTTEKSKPKPDARPNSGGHQGKKPIQKKTNANVIYIVCGSIILVLVVTGMILIIIYWKLKMGSTKIHPNGDETAMPSYKNLQAKEDTSLIKGVKK